MISRPSATLAPVLGSLVVGSLVVGSCALEPCAAETCAATCRLDGTCGSDDAAYASVVWRSPDLMWPASTVTLGTSDDAGLWLAFRDLPRARRLVLVVFEVEGSRRDGDLAIEAWRTSPWTSPLADHRGAPAPHELVAARALRGHAPIRLDVTRARVRDALHLVVRASRGSIALTSLDAERARRPRLELER